MKITFLILTMFFATSIFQVAPTRASSYYYNFIITMTPEYPLVGDEVNATVSFETASIDYMVTFNPISRDGNNFFLTIDIYVPDIVLWAMGYETKVYPLGKLQGTSYTLQVNVRVWDYETKMLLEWLSYNKRFDIPFRPILTELTILAKAYGSRPNDPNWNPNVDLDGNNIIGLSDLVMFAKYCS